MSFMGKSKYFATKSHQEQRSDTYAVEAAKKDLGADGQKRMRDAAMTGNNSDDPGDVHRGVRAAFDERIAPAGQEATEDLFAMREQMDSVGDINPNITCLEVENQVIGQFTERIGEVKFAKAQAHSRQLDLRYFMVRLGIKRPVIWPNVSLNTSILILALCLEIMGGAYLYLNALNSHLEALLTAGLVSVVTTAWGFGIGFIFLRKAIHGSRDERLRQPFHALVTVLGFAVLWLVTLMVAHDRDHLAAFDPNAEFLRRLDPAIVFRPWEWFAFETADGSLFLVLTLSVAAVAIYKGYCGFQDPIPQFNWFTAQFLTAKAEADRKAAELRSGILQVFEDAHTALSRTLARNAAVVDAADQLADAADACEQRYQDAGALAVEIANIATRLAQDAYLAIRPEKPTYFDKQYLSEREHVPALRITAADIRREANGRRAEAAHMAALAVQLKEQLNKLQLHCMRLLEQELRQLEELDPHKPRSSWDLNFYQEGRK